MLHRHWTRGLAGFAVLLLWAVPAQAELSLGEDFRLADAPLAPLPGTADRPWVSHLGVDWVRQVAVAGGEERLLQVVRDLARAHHRVVLGIDPGSHAREVIDSPDHRERWTAALRRLVTRLGDDLAGIAPLAGAVDLEPEQAAFFFKLSAVAIRSGGSGVPVVLSASPDRDAWLDRFYSQQMQPYVDVVAWSLSQGEFSPDRDRARGWRVAQMQRDPAARLWILGLPAGGWGWLSEPALVGSLSAEGFTGLAFRTGGAPAPLVEALRARLAPDVSPMPLEGVGFEAGGRSLDGIRAWRLFSPETSQVETLVVPLEPAPEGTVLVLDSFDVTGPLLHDPATGRDRFLGGVNIDRKLNRATLPLGAFSQPIFVQYRRFATPGLMAEDLQVGTDRLPPVEEIIARHQEVRARSEAAMETVLADAAIEFHYTIAGSGATIDVAFRSRYYWEKDTGAEFEHLEMFINGTRWRREKLPQVPLIQPEKVVTVPLEIHLARQYDYRLEGRDQVGGRPAWRISFSPQGSETLYSGTTWIDRETHRILRLSVTQSGLEPPVLSNQETDLFSTFPVPNGGEVSLVESLSGQQIWNTAGANFRVNREVQFTNVRVNSPDFDQRRQEAYASEHQILRDTPRGLRYVEKNDQGERVVQEPKSRSRFALGGTFFNESLDFPVPFAGINWFNYDFRGRGQQINAFIAGAANFITWSDPSLGGSRLDASVNVGVIGFTGSDRFFVGGREREDLEVEGRQQNLTFTLGIPLGHFIKIRAIASLFHDHYERSDTTAGDFIVPDDTLTRSLGLQVQFNRKGTTLTAQADSLTRDEWMLWGDGNAASTAVGTRQVDFSPRFEDHGKWFASASKDIFFRTFQRMQFAATWLDGSRQDRFSQYQFSFFSDRMRVRGFSGSGVRFDRGGLARARYTFNIGDIVSFDATLDHARVENDLLQVRGQSHTGFGLAGKFIGPWGTIVQLDYGIALRSDIPELEGEQEVQLLFLKIF